MKKKRLIKKFKDMIISFIDLQYETLMDTPLIERHYRQAIKELKIENKVYLEKEGPRGGIRPETLIIFKEKDLVSKREKSDLTIFF